MQRARNPLRSLYGKCSQTLEKYRRSLRGVGWVLSFAGDLVKIMRMTQSVIVRPATLSDTQSIAEVQVAVWRSTYKGLVPDALIDRMSVSDRAEGWTTILNSFAQSGRGACFVAEIDSVIQGFASCGGQRDDEFAHEYSGEISAIYVHEAHQRSGIGRALMGVCAQALTDMELTGISLWVLSGNDAARAFYTALGGEIITERVDDQPDGTLREVAYGWPGRADLADICG